MTETNDLAIVCGVENPATNDACRLASGHRGAHRSRSGAFESAATSVNPPPDPTAYEAGPIERTVIVDGRIVATEDVEDAPVTAALVESMIAETAPVGPAVSPIRTSPAPVEAQQGDGLAAPDAVPEDVAARRRRLRQERREALRAGTATVRRRRSVQTERGNAAALALNGTDVQSDVQSTEPASVAVVEPVAAVPGQQALFDSERDDIAREVTRNGGLDRAGSVARVQAAEQAARARLNLEQQALVREVRAQVQSERLLRHATSELAPSAPIDHVLASGPWKFDAEVTGVFDDMLRRSIPQYDVMRRTVFDVGSRFVTDRSTIVDLGASRGEALAPLVDRFGARNRFVAVEVSDPMRAVLAQRFQGLIDARVVEVRGDDLRFGYPPVLNVSLTTCVLTAMFVPIEHRQRLIRDIYESLAPGGALVIVEKVLGEGSLLNTVYTEEYLKMKLDHGYSGDEVQRKALSLEGVLVPVTADWNVDMLRRAGFRIIDCFWRWLNFAGWVAVK